MRVLVTGGSGFIGSNLTPLLSRKGHDVRVVDLIPTTDAFVKYIKGDIRSYESVMELLKDTEVVVHLAAPKSIEESIRKPQEYHETNVVGSFNLLRVCAELAIGKFICISSSAVYGFSLELPLNEETPARLVSPYGATKLIPEIFKNFQRMLRYRG